MSLTDGLWFVAECFVGSFGGTMIAYYMAGRFSK
jgi:hypothetical protein